MAITRELKVSNDTGTFSHEEKTVFGSLSEGDKKTLAVLEVGNAADHTVTADIAFRAVAPDFKVAKVATPE